MGHAQSHLLPGGDGRERLRDVVGAGQWPAIHAAEFVAHDEASGGGRARRREFYDRPAAGGGRLGHRHPQPPRRRGCRTGRGCRGGNAAWQCRGRLSEGQGDRLTDRDVVWLKRGRWRGCWLRVGRDAHAGEHHEEARDDTHHAGITPRGNAESIQWKIAVLHGNQYTLSRGLRDPALRPRKCEVPTTRPRVVHKFCTMHGCMRRTVRMSEGLASRCRGARFAAPISPRCCHGLTAQHALLYSRRVADTRSDFRHAAARMNIAEGQSLRATGRIHGERTRR